MRKLLVLSVFVLVATACSSAQPAPTTSNPSPTTEAPLPETPATTVPDGTDGVVPDIGRGDREPILETPETTVPVPVGEPTQVVAITDGWSVRIAGSSLVVPGTDITANFEPITSAGLDAFLEEHGSSITGLLARMVTPDWGVGCFGAFCTDSVGELDKSWLTDPATIPGYGSAYAAWGIPATLYAAQMTVPSDALVRFGSDTSGGVPAADRVVLSSAFGVSFAPVATWASGEPATPRSTYSSDAPRPATFDITPFWSGLATPDPVAAGLGSEQLTWMSSPTVGCGVSALCVPDRLETSIALAGPATPLAVCNEMGHIAHIDVQDMIIDVTYPFPAHQAGLWGGEGPFFSGRQVSSVRFNGTPPLVEGPQQIRLVALYWSGSSGFTQADGVLYQLGYDDPKQAERPVASIIDELFPNAVWTICDR